jgi:hypothetical protein
MLTLGIGGMALAPAAIAAPATSAPMTATVTAPGFNAGGTWQFFQSNAITVTINVTQDDSGRLFGSASFGGVVGTIEQGSVDGTSISFTIGWSNGPKGRYTGSLGSDRRLSGTCFDLNNPTKQATWSTTRTF